MILSFFLLKNTSRPLYEIEFSLRSFFFFIISTGWANSYLLEDVPFPAELPPEIGDLAFDQNGKLYACLRRGDVVVSQPGKDLSKIEWQVFATGLHNGMGMEVITPGKIVVSQMAELTLIEDLDGDGVADRYRNYAPILD